MRRALRPRLPALTHWFPGAAWDRVDEMPFGEINTYLRALAEIERRQANTT